jgi:hypothetical protein
MKTAHAIFGAVIVAFGAAAFVTFYHEFKLRPQTPPHPNAATQKTDSLTPANSIAHDFAVLHTKLASSIAPELADVPKSVDTVPPGTKTPRHPNAATQKADPLTPANSIAHDFAVLSTPANSIAPELVDVPKPVQTVPIGPDRRYNSRCRRRRKPSRPRRRRPRLVSPIIRSLPKPCPLTLNPSTSARAMAAIVSTSCADIMRCGNAFIKRGGNSEQPQCVLWPLTETRGRWN